MAPPKRTRSLLACFNGRLIYACGIIALSQLNFGMDQSAFSNTQAMPFFKRQFGTFDEATGMELALVPVLQSELVPAEARGFVVGTYQSGLLFGSLIMSIICRGTSDIKGHASWRIPHGLFFVIPSILAVAVWWIPESPRWLLTRDRQEDALKSLRLLRQGAYTEDEIEHDFQKMQNALDNTSLNSVNPFVMSCINSALNIVAVFLAQFLFDKTGRVPLMIAGAVLQTASLMTMGGLGTVKNPSQSIRPAIVATVTLFGIGFSLGWAPLSHVVAAEIPTTGLRDLTYAVGAVFNTVIQWAVAFSIPYLMDPSHAGLGSKVGFIFGVTSFLAALFSWFCIPECEGKTLEEIDELFAQGVPIRNFRTIKVSLDAEASDVGDDLTKPGKDNVSQTTHTI
ncbi:hypothetical protein FGADI_7130 [Fusarium gaditjirri]|uniref:Major facilitator superfamily (MFS) profile domain-containing protein n=1 Tax=Fusarium gaditjirri TaxID=282569 RepID=A0A8H4T633_9HYPO|nr:hypothetical protein FGADI_7130 [Fusarium gaditjirri]